MAAQADNARLLRHGMNCRLNKICRDLLIMSNPLTEDDRAVDTSRYNLLMLCGYSPQYLDAVQNLIDLGIRIDERNNHGETVLHIAAKSRNAPVLHLVLENLKKDISYNKENVLGIREWSGRMYTALHCAVRAGDADCVKLLLAAGANPKLLDSGGVSVAVIAVNKRPHLLHLVSTDWYATEWNTEDHKKWPYQFQRECKLVLMVMQRKDIGLHRDEIYCIIRALGQLYRWDRLKKGYMKAMR